LDAADNFGVVEKKGSWYSRGDLRFAQGRRPAIEFLRTNEQIANEVEVEVREIMAARLVSGAAVTGIVTTDEETNTEDENVDTEFNYE